MSKVTVSRTRRLTAIVEETVDYEIDEETWKNTLEGCDGDEVEALSEIRATCQAEHARSEIEMEEVIEEHDELVEV